MTDKANETSCTTQVFVTLGRYHNKRICLKRDLHTFVYRRFIGCCRERLINSAGFSVRSAWQDHRDGEMVGGKESGTQRCSGQDSQKMLKFTQLKTATPKSVR